MPYGVQQPPKLKHSLLAPLPEYRARGVRSKDVGKDEARRPCHFRIPRITIH